MLELCLVHPDVRKWGREKRKENFPSGKIVVSAPCTDSQMWRNHNTTQPHRARVSWVQRLLECGSPGWGFWGRKSVETQKDLFVVYACLLHVAEVRNGSGFVHRQNIWKTKRKIPRESAEGDGSCPWIWRRDFRTSMSFLEWAGDQDSIGDSLRSHNSRRRLCLFIARGNFNSFFPLSICGLLMLLWGERFYCYK